MNAEFQGIGLNLSYCMNYANFVGMESVSALAGKKAVYFTLGCKLNFAETASVEQRLEEMGVVRARKGESADICYINTCSVTEVADHKCRQAIHKLIKENPGAFVVVTGCYAQLKPDVISKIEGVSLVLGTAQKGKAVEMIVEKFCPSSRSPRGGEGRISAGLPFRE